MKKTSTLAIALCIACTASAQTLSKGTTLLGGTFGVFSQTIENTGQEKEKYNSLTISPAAGKFYRDNRMAGVNVFYSSHKRKTDEYKMNLYGLGVFLRQYKPVGKSFYLFAEEGASFQKTKSEDDNQPLYNKRDVVKQTNIGLNIYPGAAYMISKKCMIEVALRDIFSINYIRQVRTEDYTNTEPDTRTVNNVFSLNTELGDNILGSLTFGIRFLIN